MRRLAYVDTMRGVAILLMTADHAYDWWLSEAARATALWQVVHFLGSLAAPTFLYLVGIGLALSSERSAARGGTRRSLGFHLVRRGAVLVVAGYLLNLAVYFEGDNVADVWAVDILQTIGVSIWLSAPLLWAPLPLLLVALVAAGCVGQTAGGWVLPDGLAAYITGRGGIGYFPLALWLPFVWAGLLAGRWLYRPGEIWRRMATVAGAGICLLALTGFLGSAPGYRHPRPMFVLFGLAIVLWLTVGLWLWTEKLAHNGPLVKALSTMGRSSLMLYVLHHLIGYRLLRLLGWVSGRSWRGQYGTLAWIPASALLAALVTVMVVSSRWWCKRPRTVLVTT